MGGGGSLVQHGMGQQAQPLGSSCLFRGICVCLSLERGKAAGRQEPYKVNERA